MEFIADLHTKIIHFPIALLFTYVLFEVVEIVSKNETYQKAAHILLFLGVLGAFAAAFSGNQAFEVYKFWNDEKLNVLNNHELYANLTVWYFTGILILRTYFVIKKKYLSQVKYLLLVLSIIGCLLVFQTSEYGGTLVKKFGIGTELIQNQRQK